MAVATEKFFEVLEKNRLVSESALGTLRAAIKKESLSATDLDTLVGKKVLTAWQAKRILDGKGTFRIGDYRLLDLVGKDENGEVYLVANESGRAWLRLLSRELCRDESRLTAWKNRVRQIQELNAPRMCGVVDVQEAGGRTLAVVQIPSGQSIADRCSEKPQAEKTVRVLIKKLLQPVRQLAASSVAHGSIGAGTVFVDDQQKVSLALPADIGAPAALAGNDVCALAALANAMLTGDYQQQSQNDNPLSAHLLAIAGNPEAKPDDLEQLVGETAASAAEPASGPPALPDMSQPMSPLESASPQDDMFGNLDNIEVASAIADPAQTFAASQPTPPPEPDEPEPEQGKSTTLWLAVGGGAVAALAIGLGLFFYFFGGNFFGGDDEPDQVAQATSNTGQQEDDSADGKKDSSDAAGPAQDSQSDKDGSKGILSGVGVFNRQTDEAENSAPEPNGTTGTGDAADAGEATQVASGDDVEDQESVIVLTNTGDTEEMPQKPDTNAVPVATPDKAPDMQPAGSGASDPGVAETTAPPDAEPTTPQPEPPKAEPKKTGPIQLVGGNDDKPAGQENPSTNIPDPFANAPQYVSLTPLKRGASNSAEQVLFPIAVPDGFPLAMKLHGGEFAAKSKLAFEMRASTSENRTWNVSGKPSNGPGKPIGRFLVSDGHLKFAWDESASSFAAANSLVNCGISVQAKDFTHDVALRKPAPMTSLEFEKSFEPSSDGELDNLPHWDHVRVELVNLPENFPPFSYPKQQQFIPASDGTLLTFKSENIDVMRSQLTAKHRGAKVIVKLETVFVAADKTTTRLPSLAKFEQAANAFKAETERLQQGYNELMKQYNQLQTPQEKGQFSKLTNRAEIEKQVQAAKGLNRHYQRSLKVFQAIQKSKIGVRLYYQAGDMQVDLATPDGNPWVAPAPKADADKKDK